MRHRPAMRRQPALGDSLYAPVIDGGIGGEGCLPVNQIQAYRICHPLFGKVAGHTVATDPSSSSSPAAMAMRTWASCHRPCRRLTRAGICRGCQSDSDLAARGREIRSELGPGASPEPIAERMKQIAEDRGRRRLTARVRRVMEAVA